MKKTRQIIVRITETSFKRLADAIITEQKTKSTIMRDALNMYMDRSEIEIESQAHKDNKNKKSL
jgi:hypothetical protein